MENKIQVSNGGDVLVWKANKYGEFVRRIQRQKHVIFPLPLFHHHHKNSRIKPQDRIIYLTLRKSLRITKYENTIVVVNCGLQFLCSRLSSLFSPTLVITGNDPKQSLLHYNTHPKMPKIKSSNTTVFSLLFPILTQTIFSFLTFTPPNKTLLPPNSRRTN